MQVCIHNCIYIIIVHAVFSISDNDVHDYLCTIKVCSCQNGCLLCIDTIIEYKHVLDIIEGLKQHYTCEQRVYNYTN